MPSLQVLADRLMQILPADGSRMGNDDVRTLLAREIQEPIEGDVYFNVLAQLERNGEIKRARGPGGAVCLAKPRCPAPLPPKRRFHEHRLMPSLQRYLELRFWKRLELPDDANWTVVDTSTGGIQDGQWRRCDFTGIAITPRVVLGGREIDLYTFELKAADSGSVPAVHEAEAQTRGSNYGYLVWHVPDRSSVAARLDAVERECHRKGVGLILFSDPQDLDSFDHRMPAARKPTDAGAIDRFLANRLNGQTMHSVKARLAQ